jgi:rRNA maturation endonuclease Nob1
MGYITCTACKRTVPESQYCPACGHALRKWCPQCGDWRVATFTSLELDDPGTGGIIITGDQQLEEVRFCPDCGAELQSKRAPHE